MNYRKLFVACILCLSATVQAKDITITRLTCEMQAGMGTTSSAPRLGWQMTSPENGTRQTAYEIEISNPLTGHTIWNSGKVLSPQSQLISLRDFENTDQFPPSQNSENTSLSPVGADPSVRPNTPTHYTWRVRVWDETDTPSAWSPYSDFRITSPTDAFAHSHWIGAITRKDAHLPEGRKFHGSELKKPEVKAAWEASAKTEL